MQLAAAYPRVKFVEYDAIKRRLWILGQRCHHGATGALVATIAGAALLAERHLGPGHVILAATGGALMAHDWHDHTIWFELGHGTQP
jgi:hypothetical protein